MQKLNSPLPAHLYQSLPHLQRTMHSEMVVNTKTCRPRAHRMHNTKYTRCAGRFCRLTRIRHTLLEFIRNSTQFNANPWIPTQQKNETQCTEMNLKESRNILIHSFQTFQCDRSTSLYTDSRSCYCLACVSRLFSNDHITHFTHEYASKLHGI